MTVSINQQVSGAQSGQPKITTKRKDKRPLIFPILPPTGGLEDGAGAGFPWLFRPPTGGLEDGAGAGFPRHIDMGNTGVETDLSGKFAQDLIQNNPDNYKTEAETFDAIIDEYGLGGKTFDPSILGAGHNKNGTKSTVTYNPQTMMFEKTIIEDGIDDKSLPGETGHTGESGETTEFVYDSLGRTVDPKTGKVLFGIVDLNKNGIPDDEEPINITTSTGDTFGGFGPERGAMDFAGETVNAEDFPLGGSVVVDEEEDGPTGFSEAAQIDLDKLQLREEIDTRALQNWYSALLAAGLYIQEIREVPPGSGQFVAVDDTGFEHASPPLKIDPLTAIETEIYVERSQLERDRFELEEEISRENLRIEEELKRIDQDIARDRIQHEQQIAQGNWQNALDVQDRIDERERQSRQLEREMFNANQELNNRRFELERAAFDLDKLEFFQQLSSAPANFADLFNISRGLAPTGAGGPMPQGIARIGQSDVQQTAAQDFRSTGINMAPNINAGPLPILGPEQAVKQFTPTQSPLSFIAGADPTPVDSSGKPILGAEQVVPVAPVTPETLTVEPNQAQSSVDPVLPEELGTGGSMDFPDYVPPTNVSNVSAVTPGLETIADQSVVTSPAPVATTAQEVVQGAPLPPGLRMAFNQQLTGAPQTAQQSIPLLSPQALAQLTPAEREVYFGLAQMQGQYLPDFQNLLDARAGSTPITDSQRVFA